MKRKICIGRSFLLLYLWKWQTHSSGTFKSHFKTNKLFLIIILYSKMLIFYNWCLGFDKEKCLFSESLLEERNPLYNWWLSLFRGFLDRCTKNPPKSLFFLTYTFDWVVWPDILCKSIQLFSRKCLLAKNVPFSSTTSNILNVFLVLPPVRTYKSKQKHF